MEVQEQISRNKLYDLSTPMDVNGRIWTPELVLGVEFWDRPAREGVKGFRGLCYLSPPDRGHMIPGEITSVDGEDFVFTSSGFCAGDWKLKRITMERVLEKNPESTFGTALIGRRFESTLEMERSYYNQFLPSKYRQEGES